MSAPRITDPILSVAEAVGWFAVWRLPKGRSSKLRRRRLPVACWAVVEDAPNRGTTVHGLVSAGQFLTDPPEGAYFAHGSDFHRCRCARPAVEKGDPVWCEGCSGVLAEPWEDWD